MMFTYLLSLVLLFSVRRSTICFAAPMELEGSFTTPSCDANTPAPCNFANALEDVQAKIEAFSTTTRSSHFNGSGKSYVDCAECTYYREWKEAVVFWSKPNGTHALWFDWTAPDDHWWSEWNRMNATMRQEIGYPTAEPVEDQHPEDRWVSRYMQYQRGRVYDDWNRNIWGPIYDKWLSGGGAQVLGIPLTSIKCYFLPETPGRKFCNAIFTTTDNWISFINWDSETGAHIVDRRLYRSRWIWRHGIAVTDPRHVLDTDIKYMEFWTPPDLTMAIFWDNTETWILPPAIWKHYQRSGGYDGPLGVPSTNATGAIEEDWKWKIGMWGRAYGEYQQFENGALYASYTDHGRNTSSDWKNTAVYEYSGSLQDPPSNPLDFTWSTGAGASSAKATLTYAPTTRVARLSTHLTLGPEVQGNYTLTCILRDGDGQLYTFSHTEIFPGGTAGLPQIRFSERVVANETQLWYADGDSGYPAFQINWRALLFATTMECRVGRDVDLAAMKGELVRFAMSLGSYTFQRWREPREPYVIELS